MTHREQQLHSQLFSSLHCLQVVQRRHTVNQVDKQVIPIVEVLLLVAAVPMTKPRLIRSRLRAFCQRTILVRFLLFFSYERK